MVRVGSLNDSQYILKRGQILKYIEKEIFEENNTEGIKITVQIVENSELEDELSIKAP